MKDGWQAGQWHTWKLGNIMNGFGLSFLNSKGRRRCIVIHSKKESKGVQSSNENKESGDALHILTKRGCTSRCSVSYICTTKKSKGCTTWRSTDGVLYYWVLGALLGAAYKGRVLLAQALSHFDNTKLSSRQYFWQWLKLGSRIQSCYKQLKSIETHSLTS